MLLGTTLSVSSGINTNRSSGSNNMFSGPNNYTFSGKLKNKTKQNMSSRNAKVAFLWIK